MRWLPLVLLVAAALAGRVRANINDDRIAARTACYKACMSSGWDPVCAWNPKYPEETTRGGGSMVWPNACSAACMAQYCKYGEWCNLEVKYKVSLPSRCYKKAWDIYFGLTVEAPECKVCPGGPPSKPDPNQGKPLTEEQCLHACVDRDGWKPVCVEDWDSKKKFVFGNGCAARCSKSIFSPTPLYKVKKLPSSCKKQFLKTGKLSKSCSKCPRGKEDDSLFIDDDRQVARQYCYKACASAVGWKPVCAWNPQYPEDTTHGGGSMVWPNMCMADCMAQYCKYGEWCNLEKRYDVVLPKECERRMWDIWYIGEKDPTASKKLRKRCQTCPPPKA